MEGWVLLISVLFMGAYLPRRAIGTSVAFLGRSFFIARESLVDRYEPLLFTIYYGTCLHGLAI